MERVCKQFTYFNSYAIYQLVPFLMTLNETNPVFKVRPLFDTKYIINGYRYGHSYYRRRIGNHTQALNDTTFSDI